MNTFTLPELVSPTVPSITEIRTGDEEVPESYKGAYVNFEDYQIFDGVEDKDVRRTLKVGELPTPALAPDEVLIKVMASAINFNTVWTAMFEPVPTHAFLYQLASSGGWDARHLQPYHQLGSDASGIVVAVGIGVRKVKPGDKVVIFPGWSDTEDAETTEEAIIAEHQKAWGFETNFGGLAEYAVVKAFQCMTKAPHLTWEEAASNMLCGMTSYRMLVNHRGAQMRQGDIVLVWGASGGLGSYAIQLIRNGGGISVGVVNSEEKEKIAKAQGCDVVVRRDLLGVENLHGKELGKKIGKEIRNALGEDPHIVFEHVGKATFDASVFLVRKGGKVVTCGSSTGFMHTFDNRHLWMQVKKIIGSHGANSMEAWEFNRLVQLGKIVPTLSKVYTLDDVAEATRAVQLNQHVGKVAVLCCAEEEGLGIDDHEMRARVGEDKINLFRGH